MVSSFFIIIIIIIIPAYTVTAIVKYSTFLSIHNQIPDLIKVILSYAGITQRCCQTGFWSL